MLARLAIVLVAVENMGGLLVHHRQHQGESNEWLSPWWGWVDNPKLGNIIIVDCDVVESITYVQLNEWMGPKEG